VREIKSGRTNSAHRSLVPRLSNVWVSNEA
jgi:hypothetical protein